MENKEKILSMKEKFFSNLFVEKIVRYNNPKDRKYVDFKMVCTNEVLQNFFNNQYEKYKSINTMHSYHDFFCECICLTHKAINRFEIEDDGKWEDIISGADNENLLKLCKYIIITVGKDLIPFVNDHLKFTTGEVNGKKNEHLKINFEISSLDEIIVGADGSETSRIHLTDSKDNIWVAKENYLQTFFQKWFHENKERILIKSQLRLIENLSKLQHEKDDYTENDCEKVLGIPRYKANQRMKAVKERILKAWVIENPLDKKTKLQMQKEAEVCLWNQLIELVYSENIALSDQNRLISEWIVMNLDESAVSNLVYDNLTGFEARYVTMSYKDNSVPIPSKVLYKIVDAVEVRLDQLQVFDTKAIPFYRTEKEIGKFSKEYYQHYDNYIKKFKKQQCFTYDFNGELISIEDWKTPEESPNIIKTIMPTGGEYTTNNMEEED